MYFKLGYEKQKSFLDSFPEPENDIQRSYYQYRCQVYSCESRFSYLVKVIGSTVLYLFKKRKSGQANLLPEEGNEVLYLSVNHKRDMLPCEITDKPYKYISYDDSFFLKNEDWVFMKKIEKYYPHSYYFLYKILLKVGFYSYVINKYSPQTIIVHGETSFTSSLLTLYCENHGVKHVDVMHGEKVFLIRDSFFRFTDCYVWSSYHIDLFKQLRANLSNYIVSLPPSMTICKDNMIINDDIIYDYKFYLAYETKKSVEIIRNIVDKLENNGKTVILRPHPFFTDMNLLRKYFNESSIEDPKQINIEQSIVCTKNVVSVFSTVLRQAVNAGIRVVVDDLSNPKVYQGMKELKFWIYQENPAYLSSEYLNCV